MSDSYTINSYVLKEMNAAMRGERLRVYLNRFLDLTYYQGPQPVAAVVRGKVYRGIDIRKEVRDCSDPFVPQRLPSVSPGPPGPSNSSPILLPRRWPFSP